MPEIDQKFSLIRNVYPSKPVNMVYKEVENVMKMENRVIHEGKVWKITRTYKGLFSCEEAIERLLKAHLDTEEE